MAQTLTTRWMRKLLAVAAILAAGCAGPMSTAGTRTATGFSVVETGIPELQKAMSEGRVTSRQLVVEYLLRIALYEDQVKAIITVNPNVLAEAEALDRERAQGRIRGPLHGIPIALKDNIQTMDMLTTGGAIAFEVLRPPYEATVTRTLRAAGAVIIAKTVLTELANWVAGPPTPMPGNYSALAGYGLNPYDPRRDPREGTNDGRQALLARRIQLGHRHRGELLGGQRGNRDLRVDPGPGEPHDARGHQADGRADQPVRYHPAHR